MAAWVIAFSYVKMMMAKERLQPRSDEDTDSTLRQRGGDPLVYLMLLGTTIYLYLNLFVLPNIPILLSGDQVFFWVNGQRMLYGERAYLDFFQFTPPGADLFYFALFKLFGPRIWVLNAAVIVLGVALCWVCFAIAKEVMERRLALLATLLFLTLIYTRLLNATHHWFSVLIIMGAAAVLMRRTNNRRLGVAGAMLGAASFFTQTHGAAALLAVTVFLVWERYRTGRSWQDFWRSERVLLFSFVLTLLALNAYFIATVGLKQLWYFQVTYVRKVMVHRPETALLGMPESPDWRSRPLASLVGQYGQYIFVYVMLPVVYTLVLWRCWNEPHCPTFRHHKVALLSLVGSCLLAELIFSLNWLRLYAVSMAGIILFIWVLSRAPRARRYAVTAVSITIACLAFQETWSAQHSDYVLAALPAGTSATNPQEYEKLLWFKQHTKPGEFVFQAGWPGLYIPLELRNPVFLDTAGTMADSQWAQRAVQQLEAKEVRYVLWSARLDYPTDPRRPWTTHIVPLRSYLLARYMPIRAFPDGEEIWERR
jgi:hypothetical protein